MTEPSTNGLPARAPKAMLEREIKPDLRQLGEALVGGGTDALKGDWYGAARRLSKGFIGGLGLKADDAGVLAWRLVLTALRRAVLGLVDECRSLLRPAFLDVVEDGRPLLLRQLCQLERANALPDEI